MRSIAAKGIPTTMTISDSGDMLQRSIRPSAAVQLPSACAIHPHIDRAPRAGTDFQSHHVSVSLMQGRGRRALKHCSPGLHWLAAQWGGLSLARPCGVNRPAWGALSSGR